jgi:hypothetical protein
MKIHPLLQSVCADFRARCGWQRQASGLPLAVASGENHRQAPRTPLAAATRLPEYLHTHVADAPPPKRVIASGRGAIEPAAVRPHDGSLSDISPMTCTRSYRRGPRENVRGTRYPIQDRSVQATRPRDFGQLEGHPASMVHDLAADLDRPIPPGRQGPVLRRGRQCRSSRRFLHFPG